MNRHKFLLALVSILLIVTFILVGCSTATPTPTSTPTPTPTLTPTTTNTSPIVPMKLKWHDHGPPGRPATAPFEWWMQEVTKQTNGAITFDLFWSESLGKAANQVDNLKSGLFDVASWQPAFGPGKTPLWEVGSLPLVKAKILTMGKAAEDLALLPEMQAELKQWNAKFIAGQPTEAYNYMGIKPVLKIEDLKGLRVRGYGLQVNALPNLGAVPVAIAGPEVYDALNRGTIDGVLYPWSTAVSYSLQEVSKYRTKIDFGAVFGVVAINLDTWNKLDPRAQQIMLDLAKQIPAQFVTTFKTQEAAAVAKLDQKGVAYAEFSKDEHDKLVNLGAKPVWDDWVKQMESKGLAGKKVLDTYLAAIAKYEPK